MQVWAQASKIWLAADIDGWLDNVQACVPARCKLLVVRAAVDACDAFGVILDQALYILQTAY